MNEVLTTHIVEVLQHATIDFKEIQQRAGSLDTKLNSEILSKLIERGMEKVIPNTRRGAGDHEADVYIADCPLEIKNTHNSRTWRGGTFSKRAGHFVFVSWRATEAIDVEWFAITTELIEADWNQSTSKSYYATNITLDELLSKNGHVLVGDVRKAKKLTHPVYTAIATGEV